MSEQIPEDISEAARAFVPDWAYMDNRVEAVRNIAAAAMLFERRRAPGPIDMERQEAAFEAYKAAHIRMLETMAFADAMAAKRAYLFFLDLVDTNCADAKVVRFPSQNRDFRGQPDAIHGLLTGGEN